MSKHQTVTTAHQLHSLLEAGRLGDLTDGQLLAKFLAVADNPELAETAFAVLVERHGPMVFRVCHSVTRDAHDAEDAFQATFLVLVRKARRLNVRVTLAPWLHNVARKVSLHARADRVRRCRNEKSLARSPWARSTALANDPTALEREELDGLVHSEVARLPQRYRDCLVLCDLEGCTYEQAAQTLELPLGTVQSRLARARKRLHDRFSRIGLHPSRPGRTGASLVIGLPSAKVVPPISLFRTTTAKCLHGAAGGSAGLKFVSGSIATLVHRRQPLDDRFQSDAHRRGSLSGRPADAASLSTLKVHRHVSRLRIPSA